MKNNDLTKRNDSKMIESKISKNLQQTKVPQQRLATPKMTKAAKFLQKWVEQSMMIMPQAIHQTM